MPIIGTARYGSENQQNDKQHLPRTQKKFVPHTDSLWGSGKCLCTSCFGIETVWAAMKSHEVIMRLSARWCAKSERIINTRTKCLQIRRAADFMYVCLDEITMSDWARWCTKLSKTQKQLLLTQLSSSRLSCCSTKAKQSKVSSSRLVLGATTSIAVGSCAQQDVWCVPSPLCMHIFGAPTRLGCSWQPWGNVCGNHVAILEHSECRNANERTDAAKTLG